MKYSIKNVSMYLLSSIIKVPMLIIHIFYQIIFKSLQTGHKGQNKKVFPFIHY